METTYENGFHVTARESSPMHWIVSVFHPCFNNGFRAYYQNLTPWGKDELLRTVKAAGFVTRAA